jgi:hypothetical protein
LKATGELARDYERYFKIEVFMWDYEPQLANRLVDTMNAQEPGWRHTLPPQYCCPNQRTNLQVSVHARELGGARVRNLDWRNKRHPLTAWRSILKAALGAA